MRVLCSSRKPMRKTPVSGFPRALLSLSHARKRRALASRLALSSFKLSLELKGTETSQVLKFPKSEILAGDCAKGATIPCFLCGKGQKILGGCAGMATVLRCSPGKFFKFAEMHRQCKCAVFF